MEKLMRCGCGGALYLRADEHVDMWHALYSVNRVDDYGAWHHLVMFNNSL